MKNGFYKIMTGLAVSVLAAIAMAPIVLHAPVPESIWGMVIGALSGLASTLIPSGEERYEIRIPSGARARMQVEVEE